jgi:hypothetical protein
MILSSFGEKFMDFIGGEDKGRIIFGHFNECLDNYFHN